MRPGAAGVVGYNQYSYVGNNPTSLTDPTGRQAMPEYIGTNYPPLTVIEGGKAAGGVSLLTKFIVGTLIFVLIAPYICMAVCPAIGPDGSPDAPPEQGGEPGPGGQPGPGTPPGSDTDPDPGDETDPDQDPDPDRDKNRCKNQGIGSIWYGPMQGAEATGGFGRLTLAQINMGTDTDRHAPPPPGYKSSPPHARGHLVGRQLGGDGKNPANIVTLYQTMNRSLMAPLERLVRLSVEACNVVNYSVIPNYGGGSLPVGSLTISAITDAGVVVVPPIPLPNEEFSRP